MRSRLNNKSAVYAGKDAMDLSSWESSTCPSIEIKEVGEYQFAQKKSTNWKLARYHSSLSGHLAHNGILFRALKKSNEAQKAVRTHPQCLRYLIRVTPEI
ncbi:uncharacterized protein N7529_008269 [Penicillium soppii]|uniref:uncharacterized protein n=1 Tax=Penicillium soppii TaxID=69789 RepID=UPI0025495A18|nr:uncharacterized protein N7529_008269 [Penicillium soppii]KAJ5860959.1 hypothetical protein N7529_008269 [Penicillium soppii]